MPEYKAREYLFSDITSNLRTIKRFAEIINRLGREYTYIDRAFLNAILLCLANICEGKFDFDNLISKKTEAVINARKFGMSNNKNASYFDIYDDIRGQYASLKNNKFEVFYLQANDILKRFKIFNSYKTFLETIYNCVDTDKIDTLKLISFNYEKCPLKNIFDDSNTLRNANSIVETSEALEKNISYLLSLLKDPDLSKVYLLFYYAYLCEAYNQITIDNSLLNAEKIVESSRNAFINAAVKEFFETTWSYENIFEYNSKIKTAFRYRSKDTIELFVETLIKAINKKEDSPEKCCDNIRRILELNETKHNIYLNGVKRINVDVFEYIAKTSSVECIRNLKDFANHDEILKEKIKKAISTANTEGKLNRSAKQIIKGTEFDLKM